MKNRNVQIIIILLIAILTVQINVIAQDTFSIVAVDTVTGEIGSAGASCVGPFGEVGAFILSDVIEGIGAIHTQAYWNATNQQNAHNKMLEGLSPQEIIDWLDTEDIYEAKVTTDLSLGYDITDNLTFLVGGANIFDEYPTMQDTETETGGLWDAVQMGFSGRFYFAKLILGF